MMRVSSSIERPVAAWYRWAGQHFLCVHAVLAALVAWSLLRIRTLPVDPDWLNLFGDGDPVLVEYARNVDRDGTAGALYLKITPESSGRTAAVTRQLSGLDGVAGVAPLTGLRPGPGPDGAWFAVSLEPALSSSGRGEALERIHECLQHAGLEYGVTGAEQVLREFRRSVQADFVHASVLSLCLVAAILVAAFGLNPALLLGLVYELAGLTIALALCTAWTGPLNMLSAALPCVLVGLGADYVIHCLSSAGAAAHPGRDTPAVCVFRRVGKPMFWGTVTTAAAFAGLALADLRGLRSVGVLGALGVSCMFALVMLLLPPALDRHGGRVRRPFRPFFIPERYPRRRLPALAVAATCIGLSPFALTLRSEHEIENLYDPDMPSLRLQRELTGVLGVYPSLLYVTAHTEQPAAAADALAREDLPFVADLARLRVSGEKGAAVFSCPVLPKENPFDRTRFDALVQALEDALGAAGARDITVTGDARLSHHLNDLLQRGMLRALAAVFGVLVLSLGIAFRRLSLVLLPMVSLGIALLGILGALGLLGVAMSAYTLTLIPLFLGIGIDDLFVITHGRRPGDAQTADPSLEFAILLTTLTTIVGYGSLLTARNRGFAAMGTTAVIGLALMYLTAAFVLPALLCRTAPEASARRGPEAGTGVDGQAPGP
jgi:predicted RND superfamily exporter protein